MTSKRAQLLERMRELVAEIGDGDGISPRLAKRREKRSSNNHRKARQLCGQVARALNIELSISGDPVLNGLWVKSVEPAPDVKRLQVTVCPTSDDDRVPPQVRLGRIEACLGRLRGAVAQAITRKRTPELRFVVAMPSEDGEGQVP